MLKSGSYVVCLSTPVKVQMCWQGDAFVTWWIQVECQGSVLFHSQTLMHVSTRDWEQDCTTSQTELYRAIAIKGPAESNLLSRGRGGSGGMCVSLVWGVESTFHPHLPPYTTILCTTSPLRSPPYSCTKSLSFFYPLSLIPMGPHFNSVHRLSCRIT